MKKIGVVTWYKNGNFGGTLQAIALSKTLNMLGYDTEMIHYQLPSVNEDSLQRKMRACLFSLLYPTSHTSRVLIWNDVAQQLKQSTKLNTWDDLIAYAACYEKVICGSDQIWSSIHGCTPFYFLQFVPENKRIAYAPSIGLNDIDVRYRADFQSYIQSIPYLSVREEKGAEIIERYGRRQALVVVDPVYLLTGEQWRQYYQTRSFPDYGKYVLCYFMSETTEQMRTAKAVAEYMGCQLIAISCKKHTRFPCTRLSCGTQGFLHLIDHAELFLTDSFHGSSFGTLLGTQSRTFMRFSETDSMCQNSRLDTIFSKFALENMRINTAMQPEEIVGHTVDLGESMERIAEEREKSMEYLKAALATGV